MRGAMCAERIIICVLGKDLGLRERGQLDADVLEDSVQRDWSELVVNRLDQAAD